MHNKAQAAFEFLSTYGWALLVILIMIGALAYFGILNPGKVLPNRCYFGPEFSCVDHQINTDGFKLKLRNSIGSSVNIVNFTLSTESSVPFECLSNKSSLSLQNWRSGDLRDVFFTQCNSVASGILPGSKAKINIGIRYYEITSGVEYSKVIEGEIFSNVID